MEKRGTAADTVAVPRKIKMNIPKISKRLLAAASFVREGVFVADVGTDHAYLPIYLYKTGKIAGGVASDINKGPVERAMENILSYGADKKISVVLTDGLRKIEEYSPDDVMILGMGGELIVKILSEAPWVKNKKYRLILQPMTHPEITRKYLYENGFSIVDECIVDDEKIYQIICAEHSGKIEEITNVSECELMFGKLNIERRSELLFELLKRTKKVFEERIKGKQIAGADSSEEEKMIKNIDMIINGEI